MPFFTDYGNYLHGSAPFSSQYYSQLLPYPGSNTGVRSAPRVHMARNFNSIAVEQTLRAIRRSPGAVAARHYARPVHVNTSEIDVTSPRRPRRTTATTETAVDASGGGGNDGVGGGGGGSVIHRGRTVVRLHTNKNKRSEKPAEIRLELTPAAAAETTEPPPRCAAGLTLAEEGLAKKGTIKRHTSAGVKVPVNDDRRPSVTDEILREQEALFDTMIMEEMEGQEKRARRKSYPVDMGGGGGGVGGGKQPHRTRETRKKSVAAAMVYGEHHADKPAKNRAGNWKLNYDVIIEESGIEPVSFTFKLNNTAKKESDGRSGDNGKLDANHNVVISKSHDNDSDIGKKNNSNKKHAKTVINKNQSNNDNSEGGAVGEEKKTKVVKKKIIVKKKVVKKKKKEEEEEEDKEKEERSENRQDKQKLQKKKTPSPQKKGSSSNAVAASAVITPFVRASFGKTFISPSQVSSTKSKFEKPKPKVNLETPPPPPPPPTPKTPLAADNGSSSDDDESSREDDTSSASSSSSSSSLCSGSSGSTFYDSDDYGDKRIACSNSSFDSGLPSSPVPAPDPIGRNKTTLTPHNIIIILRTYFDYYYYYYY